MAATLARMIINNKASYRDVINKYGTYKQDIDSILVLESFGHLIE